MNLSYLLEVMTKSEGVTFNLVNWDCALANNSHAIGKCDITQLIDTLRELIHHIWSRNSTYLDVLRHYIGSASLEPVDRVSASSCKKCIVLSLNSARNRLSGAMSEINGLHGNCFFVVHFDLQVDRAFATVTQHNKLTRVVASDDSNQVDIRSDIIS